MYGFLLRLYPDAFRNEFQGQMLLDFTDMATDASNRGTSSLVLFCLRELIDFPINLLQVHLKESRMIRVSRSQPVNVGMRSGLLFGVTFGLYILMYELAVWIEPRLENYIPVQLPNAIVSSVLDGIGFALTGLVFGALFAVLLADRSKWFHYLLVGTLCWFLQFTPCNLPRYFFDFAEVLGGWGNLYVYNLRLLLSGAMLGLIFIVAQSKRREPVRLLTVYVVAYPILTYYCVAQIFGSFFVTTPWGLGSLIVLWLTLLGGILVFARKYDANGQMIWIVVVGALGNLIFRGVVIRGAYSIMPPLPPEGLLYIHPAFWSVVFILVAAYVVCGILLGFLLGWLPEAQKSGDLQRIMA
jgi:hypothetical protein